MEQFKNAAAYVIDKPSAVTIGTFDGVHLGHQAILKRLVDTSIKDNLNSVVLTFFPHPRMVLQKDANIKLINTIDERSELLEASGIDHLVVHPFTKAFSRMTALEYVRDILVKDLKAKKIIIGYDHRFGRNRNADISDLKEFGKQFNFQVEEISAQELDDVAISSTKIRKALQTGDIETANKYLGYHFMLGGTVVKGKGIGKTLGFPTANLYVPEPYKIIPGKGVYVVKATFDSSEIIGITSIGTNPTVNGKEITIETHFLDFDENLYDKPLRLRFLTHIRDEETFPNVQTLTEAIIKDEIFARNYINEMG